MDVRCGGRRLVLCLLWLSACRPAPAPRSDLQAQIAEARTVSQRDGPRAAVPQFDAILSRARHAGDRRAEALVLGHLGTAYKNLGEYDRALGLHRQSLALKRALADRAEEGKTLNNIGLVYWSRGDCTQALQQYDASLAIFDALGLTDLSASVTNNTGLCLDTLGRYADSRSAYQRALALHRKHGNALGESETLANLGGVHLLLGRFTEATAAYSQALEIDTRLESQQGIVVDLINLASASLGRGLPSTAMEHLHRARDRAKRAGLVRKRGMRTGVWGGRWPPSGAMTMRDPPSTPRCASTRRRPWSPSVWTRCRTGGIWISISATSPRRPRRFRRPPRRPRPPVTPRVSPPACLRLAGWKTDVGASMTHGASSRPRSDAPSRPTISRGQQTRRHTWPRWNCEPAASPRWRRMWCARLAPPVRAGRNW